MRLMTRELHWIDSRQFLSDAPFLSATIIKALVKT